MQSFTSGSFLLMLLSVGVAQAQDRPRAALPKEETVARYGLVRRWYGYAPVDGVREKVQSIMVVGDQVHLQTNASRIHVMHAESGKLLWSAQLGRPIPGQFGSAINSKSVFAIHGTSLYRLDRLDGTQRWTFRLPSVPNAAPSADESHVIVSTADGRVYLYAAEDHELIWYYQTNKPVSMPAALLDERIACASEDNMMYVFQVASRNPTLRFQTDGPVSAPMATFGARLVLVPSRDYNVYCVDVRTGEERWRYTSGAEIRRPVSVIGDEAYVLPEDNGMHVLNAGTTAKRGERLWWYPRAQEFVAASEKRVYAADKFHQLLILDRSNGRVLGVWDTHEFDFRARNETNDRLSLATRDGLIVCLHERENKEPFVHPKGSPTSDGQKPGKTPAKEKPEVETP